MRRVPWHVKGVDRDAQEVAREAARRSGLSIGQWLNSLIIDAAGNKPEAIDRKRPSAGAPPPRGAAPHQTTHSPDSETPRGPLRGGSPMGDRAPPMRKRARRRDNDWEIRRPPDPGLAAAGDRNRAVADHRPYPRSPETLLDAREMDVPHGEQDADFGIDAALAEITARQHVLDGIPIAPPPARGGPPVGSDPPTGNGVEPKTLGAEQKALNASVEHQLREIAERMRTLQSAARPETRADEPQSNGDTAPARMIEGIEAQLHRLAGQIETLRATAAADSSVEGLRHDLADIARRVGEAAPAGASTALQDQIRTLSQEIARLGAMPRVEEIAAALRHDLDTIAATLENAIPARTAAAIAADIQALDTRIAGLGAPAQFEHIAESLRRDLMEIGTVLHEAMPTDAIAALEQEIRTLGERIESMRSPAAPPFVTSNRETNPADLRELSGAMTPAEDIARLGDSTAMLSAQADAMTSERMAGEIIGQLEQAMGVLHGLIAQAASQDAVDGLARDIHALAEKFEASQRDETEAETAIALERRLAEMTEAIERSRAAESGALAAQHDSIVDRLAERLEAIEASATDKTVLKSIEERIGTLAEKLDQSEERLVRLDGVGRGVDVLSAQLNDLRTRNEDKLRALAQELMSGTAEAVSAPAEAIRRDLAALREAQTSADRHTRESLQAVYGSIEQVVDRKLDAVQKELVAITAEAVSAPTEAIRRDVAALKEIQSLADRRTQETFEAMHGTIEQVVDRLASLEEGHREIARTSAVAAAISPLRAVPAVPAPQSPSAPVESSRAPPPSFDPQWTPPPPPLPEPQAASAEPTNFSALDMRPSPEVPVKGKAVGTSPAQPRPLMNSELPPDSPLEPGSAARRVRVVTAADRIAASEAANQAVGAAVSKPGDAIPPNRSNFVAAARRAAQAVANQQADGKQQDNAATVRTKPRGGLMQRFRPRIKSLVLAVSVVMLVLGALRLALDLFYNSNASGALPTQPASAAQDAAAPPAPSGAPMTPAPSESVPPAALPAPQPSAPPPGDKGAELIAPIPSATRVSLGGRSPLERAAIWGMPPELMLAGTGAQFTAAARTGSPATKSVPTPADPAATAGSTAAATPPTPAELPAHDALSLPPTIGSKPLIDAALAGDLGAIFEVASRYADGRNVPQDLAIAAAWFDRAASSGMALAQFRVASMYEKGVGVKKNLNEARRLYLAAADQGNAKAMHNLAVLYAEGIDGTPNYAVAAQWFGKAAAYGVVDSQYNLAILTARGVGVERSLVDSYKWFALAAKGGDKDAGQKRDEIASRLDQRQLATARQAVETFTPERQPDEAVSTMAPPDGWDAAVAAAPAKSRVR